MQEIGKLEQEVAQLRLHAIEVALEALGLVADPGDFRQQRRRILPPALRRADLLRQRVAPGLQLLGARLDVLPVALERLEPRGIERDAPPGESGDDLGEVVAQ